MKPVTNPADPFAMVVLTSMVAGGVLAAVWYATRNDAGGTQSRRPCASMPPGPSAPYGWTANAAGECVPAAAPAEAQQCGERFVWSKQKKQCVVPQWNRLPEAPPAPFDVEMGPGGQITIDDQENLDILGYEPNETGIFAFQQDFNLINALLAEQGSLTMGDFLMETGTINDTTRNAMGWAMAYESVAGSEWQGIMARAYEIAG